MGDTFVGSTKNDDRNRYYSGSVFKSHGYKFEIAKVQYRDAYEMLQIDIFVTNKAKEERILEITDEGRIVDDKGNEYHPDEINFGKEDVSSYSARRQSGGSESPFEFYSGPMLVHAENNLLYDIPEKLSLKVDEFDKTASLIVYFELVGNSRNSEKSQDIKIKIRKKINIDKKI